jgi:hypothetical protein
MLTISQHIPFTHSLKVVNSTSERPTEALLAIGSVIAILALLLLLLSSSEDLEAATSAAAPTTESSAVAVSNEN